jgi:hypothetical protein
VANATSVANAISEGKCEGAFAWCIASQCIRRDAGHATLSGRLAWQAYQTPFRGLGNEEGKVLLLISLWKGWVSLPILVLSDEATLY